MTKKDKYLVALDVGSTKTCAVIGEVDETGVKFVAMGAAESKGLRKGSDRQYRRDGDFRAARD